MDQYRCVRSRTGVREAYHLEGCPHTIFQLSPSSPSRLPLFPSRSYFPLPAFLVHLSLSCPFLSSFLVSNPLFSLFLPLFISYPTFSGFLRIPVSFSCLPFYIPSFFLSPLCHFFSLVSLFLPLFVCIPPSSKSCPFISFFHFPLSLSLPSFICLYFTSSCITFSILPLLDFFF